MKGVILTVLLIVGMSGLGVLGNMYLPSNFQTDTTPTAAVQQPRIFFGLFGSIHASNAPPISRTPAKATNSTVAVDPPPPTNWHLTDPDRGPTACRRKHGVLVGAC